MKTISTLILENFTTIILAIGLGILAITNNDLDKRTNRSFVFFTILVLVLVVSDTVDHYLSGFSEVNYLRCFTSALGYTLRPAAIVILIDILLRRWKSSLILWLPIIIVGILAFTSGLTHLMFWFDSGNQFMRGPLGYLPHIISALYILLFVIMTIKIHRHISSSEIFVVLYSAFICVLATVLESVLSDYKFLLTGAMITSCALYYVVLYIETYRRDPLTGLMNRRSFYGDAQKMQNRTLTVISIDLNGLKDINDNQGHKVGDIALQNMAKAMEVESGKKFSAYRVGGDEFMALGKGNNVDAINSYIKGMTDSLKEDKLMASFGYAFYRAGDKFDEVCNKADEQMYNDKKQYKHRSNSREDN